MHRLTATLVLLLLVACTAPPAPRTPADFAREFGGDQATYQQVLALANCAELANEGARGQNNYEDTGDRAWQGYQEAADQRFDELACTVD
jgi:outer membrane biogenesis lipoprotein LolB